MWWFLECSKLIVKWKKFPLIFVLGNVSIIKTEAFLDWPLVSSTNLVILSRLRFAFIFLSKVLSVLLNQLKSKIFHLCDGVEEKSVNRNPLLDVVNCHLSLKFRISRHASLNLMR